MSRRGKLPVTIPSGVTVEVSPQAVTVRGPKGQLVQPLPPKTSANLEGQVLTVMVKHPDLGEERALWGLARQLIANAVKGVSEGFSKRLELSGIGFKAQLEGKDLVLNLGFSHPVKYSPPSSIGLAVEKGNAVIVTGADKQLVGQVAAEIRALKKPEPYKGKGIKYSTEIVRRKAGKVVKAAGAK